MSKTPNEMQFIDCAIPGGPEVLVLKRGPTPRPGEGEVLIRVEAAGVNRPDVVQRKGAYPPPPGASPVLGLEVAGTIEALGASVSGWKTGDRVCALVAGGGYAEYCVAPALQCLPIPRRMSATQAAALPETFFTVWANVFMRGGLKSGESILIHGGSSGIGTTAIQLAREVKARVFVTVGSEAKLKACLELGATGAVNYKTQDFVAEIRNLNQGQGMNLILDMVGGDYFQKNLELLASEGRLVQIAFQKGEKVEASLRSIMARGLTVTGSMLRPRSVEQKGAIARELLREVWPMLESEHVHPILDRVFPLAQASEAHRRMESSEHIGKIVLTVQPS